MILPSPHPRNPLAAGVATQSRTLLISAAALALVTPGQLIAQNAEKKPALEEVIGKPVVHLGALYHFVREAGLFNKERIEANHSLNTFDELADGLRQLKSQGI